MSVKYETDRLTYAMMTAEDGDLMLDLDSDPEVMRYITNGKCTTPEDMRDVYIPRMLSYTDETCGWGLWKTFRKEDGGFIGWFLLRPNKDAPREVEIGWRFKQKYWGMGYGTEGATLFRDHSFAQANVEKLYAIALPGNTGSIGIMKKIGMTFIKRYIHEDTIFDPEEVVHYEMKAPTTR
tara:strand:+ start:2158 stop:2697 length:540 start_codon:yes stop_codon:yes gene_type:complete